MKHLRVIDQNGNDIDYETEFVPRIGERIMVRYGIGGGPLQDHHFRVVDVEYRFDNSADSQVGILVKEEASPKPWPH